MAALDATIVATAAPTISRDLNSAAGYTWIGAAFLLANAAAGPIWAKLSDIWGRKMIVLAALAVFFASSTVCATAKTMEALIIGRLVILGDQLRAPDCNRRIGPSKVRLVEA